MTLNTPVKFLIVFSFILTALSPVQAKSMKFKIATLSPDGSMWMEKMLAGAKQVARETENRVTFKFYPSGRMGSDKMVLKKIKIGQLHGGALVSGSLSPLFKANQLYTQPMKFGSIDEVDYVRKYMDDFIIKGIEDIGFVTFGLIGGGFAYIMSKYPIETVGDLKKVKVWIPDNNTISQESINAFDIHPIPLPIADVRISLQSGLIDTVATSPMGALVLQWHTQIKYITEVPLIYLHAVIVIEKKQFMKVSPTDQEILHRIMGQVSRDIQAQNRIDDRKNIEVLKKRGIQFIMPGESAMKEWKLTGRRASEKMMESGVLPEPIVRKMDMHLKTFHGNLQASDVQ